MGYHDSGIYLNFPNYITKGYALRMEQYDKLSGFDEFPAQNDSAEGNTLALPATSKSKQEVEVYVFKNVQKLVNVYSMMQYGSSRTRVRTEA